MKIEEKNKEKEDEIIKKEKYIYKFLNKLVEDIDIRTRLKRGYFLVYFA